MLTTPALLSFGTVTTWRNQLEPQGREGFHSRQRRPHSGIWPRLSHRCLPVEERQGVGSVAGSTALIKRLAELAQGSPGGPPLWYLGSLPGRLGLGVKMSPVASYLLVQQCLYHVVGNLRTESPKAELSADAASAWGRRAVLPQPSSVPAPLQTPPTSSRQRS